MVSSENFIRLSGLFMAAGGLLATAGWLFFAVFDPLHKEVTQWMWWPSNLLIIFGGVFVGLGLPGFYLTQADYGGVTGSLAFICLFAGLTLALIGVQSIETTTMPAIPAGMKKLVSITEPCLFVVSFTW